MKTTKIEWTDKTWNPITGCTKVSAGCANCNAEVMSRRLQAMRQEKYVNGFSPFERSDYVRLRLLPLSHLKESIQTNCIETIY